jgi:hypothetical protein
MKKTIQLFIHQREDGTQHAEIVDMSKHKTLGWGELVGVQEFEVEWHEVPGMDAATKAYKLQKELNALRSEWIDKSQPLIDQIKALRQELAA